MIVYNYWNLSSRVVDWSSTHNWHAFAQVCFWKNHESYSRVGTNRCFQELVKGWSLAMMIGAMEEDMILASCGVGRIHNSCISIIFVDESQGNFRADHNILETTGLDNRFNLLAPEKVLLIKFFRNCLRECDWCRGMGRRRLFWMPCQWFRE